MINISQETLINYYQASDQLPGKPHVSTIYRWSTRGVRGVRLETILVGGKRFTSVEALNRFTRSATAAGQGNSSGSWRRS